VLDQSMRGHLFHPADHQRTVIDRRLEDIPWVLDNLLALNDQHDPTLVNIVNPNQVGLAGHSFGAWTTLEIMQIDSRFRAGMAMNPGARVCTHQGQSPDPARISRPTLLVAGELDALVDFGNTEAFFDQIPRQHPTTTFSWSLVRATSSLTTAHPRFPLWVARRSLLRSN